MNKDQTPTPGGEIERLNVFLKAIDEDRIESNHANSIGPDLKYILTQIASLTAERDELKARLDSELIMPTHLLDVHAIADQRDAAVTECDSLQAQVGKMREALESCTMKVDTINDQGCRNYLYGFDESLVQAALSTPAPSVAKEVEDYRSTVEAACMIVGVDKSHGMLMLGRLHDLMSNESELRAAIKVLEIDNGIFGVNPVATAELTLSRITDLSARRVELIKECTEIEESNIKILRDNVALGSKLTAASSRIQLLEEALKNCANELGVPNRDYPAPVSNAVAIIQAALKRETAQPKMTAENSSSSEVANKGETK